MTKSIAALFLLISVSQTTLAEQSLSKSRYITGGILGTIPGFGIGHAVQGRYGEDRGWIFTTGEGVAVTYIFMSGLFACEGLMGEELDSCNKKVQQKFMIGNLVYWGFHIWEIVDVWKGAENKAPPKKSVLVLPGIIDKNTPGVMLAVQF